MNSVLNWMVGTKRRGMRLGAVSGIGSASALSFHSCLAFLDQDEGFVDLAFTDPTLKPAFTSMMGRKSDFNTGHIGSSFTTSQMLIFYPHLIQHLLDTPEQERLMCFSRLFAKIATAKSSKAE